jgi:polyisoprenoid-binding protein YceI
MHQAEEPAYPHIIFTAQQVTLTSEGATVTGTLQVRGHAQALAFPSPPLPLATT